MTESTEIGDIVEPAVSKASIATRLLGHTASPPCALLSCQDYGDLSALLTAAGAAKRAGPIFRLVLRHILGVVTVASS